jgi:hypothetical protein
MGTDLVVSTRAQLAGYAGFTGLVRGRGKRIATIAAVDILAVGVALGALHLGGVMMGSGALPDLVPPVSAAEPTSATTPIVPVPRTAPHVAAHLAAEPDATVMFAAPVDIAEGFTLAAAPAATSTFTTPTPSAEPAAEGPTLAAAEPQGDPVPLPRLRPVAHVAAIAAPVIDAADGSLDRLLMRDIPDASTAVRSLATTTLNTGTGAVTRVASAAPLQGVTQTVVQTATAPVQQVVSTVRGLLN